MLGLLDLGRMQPQRRPSVLVVDDERNIRATLAVCLADAGCETSAVATADAALSEVAKRSFDLAFVDLRLGEQSGLDLVPLLVSAQPGLAIVVITAFATFDTAVEAVKRGAVDYVPKPFTPAQIRHVLTRILETGRIRQRTSLLEERLSAEVPEADFGTRSPAMQRVLDVLWKAADSDAPILLRGESGTGKGLLARAIHAKSLRADGPLVVVNCPTLSGELLASELFGHARGAFTGAVRDEQGKADAAEHGTLFLDEITEITPPLQSKLLRFVQDKEFERVGETRTRRADVRVIAATNRDLDREVKEGRFREDLLYRLNVIEVTVPPLRERQEDIVGLARGFLDFFAKSSGRPRRELLPDAEASLLAHTWPGNVRELRNAVERAVILSPSTAIGAGALPWAPSAPVAAPAPGGPSTLDELEREHIVRVLGQSPSLEDAAKTLGIDASTLWRKRKRYGI
jgi:two-component system, NtrC family, response regulator AlgB